MHEDEIDVDDALVRRLVDAQMPHFAALPISKIEPWGTDNGIWRLGDDHVVRLPRIAWAEGQVTMEATWLPHLGPLLPIAVPVTRPGSSPSPSSSLPMFP